MYIYSYVYTHIICVYIWCLQELEVTRTEDHTVDMDIDEIVSEQLETYKKGAKKILNVENTPQLGAGDVFCDLSRRVVDQDEVEIPTRARGMTTCLWHGATVWSDRD